ncbi:MAG: AI-2E family transporter [Nanoarchaeota archaeon]|nr:AI-2E family transporter [Nanoarchaeota archaeon]MBU1030368.1 AI-2E family transporter [Nanoarchaeota archaeon]MBU1850291.1 AI-2E family transporter [Nanoarchaeota archaeon]
MEKEKITRYWLIIVSLIILTLSFFIVKDFLAYIVFAFVLIFGFYPLYRFLNKKIKNKNVCAWLMILIILIIIIIPLFFIINSLVQQSYSAYNNVNNIDFNKMVGYIDFIFKKDINIDYYFQTTILKIRDGIIRSAPGFIGSVADIILGLFIMFFVMFYGFKEGNNWVLLVKNILPLKNEAKERLFMETANVTKGVIYGQFLTSFIQGALGTIAFLILGIPGAVFWGFIMMILAFIPVLGTPIIWLPTALIQLAIGRTVQGIILLIFGFVILINIDNLLKPKLVSAKSKIHPLVALIGLFGGLKLFGLIGIILGPLILAILFVGIKFYTEEL